MWLGNIILWENGIADKSNYYVYHYGFWLIFILIVSLCIPALIIYVILIKCIANISIYLKIICSLIAFGIVFFLLMSMTPYGPDLRSFTTLKNTIVVIFAAIALPFIDQFFTQKF